MNDCCNCWGVQEMEQNEAKYEKEFKVNISLQHWAGCIMVDMCMKFH